MKEFFEIFYLLIGVALVALLVSHAQGTAQVLSSGAAAFGGLLQTVESPGQSADFGNGGLGGLGSF